VSAAVDLSALLGPVRDQGHRSTCLAFAATAAHELARLRRRGDPRPTLGEELLYWRCKEIDEDVEPGTAPASAIEAICNPGQSDANLWPYEGGRDESGGSWMPPSAALDKAVVRRGSMSEINTDPVALRKALEAGHAVILGLDLWEEFYAAPAGAVGVPVEEDLLGDGHAVALVGFSLDGTFRIRNSWGPTWGEDGLASIEEAALSVAALGAWMIEDDLDP
jgi:hypothetical protein